MLRPYTVGILRGLPRSQFALAPLPLRCGVHGGEVAAVVPEDVESTLSLRQTVVVDLIGRELVVDPAHHPFRSHAWYVAGSGPVRQAVQGVERGVLRGEGSLLSPDPERLQALKYVPPLLKLVYQTHRGYTVAILALRVVRSFIPLAVLWIGKLIIDGVIAAMQVRAAGGVVDWWSLGGLVGLELGIAVGGEGLARLSSLFESLLGDLFSNRISV